MKGLKIYFYLSLAMLFGCTQGFTTKSQINSGSGAEVVSPFAVVISEYSNIDARFGAQIFLQMLVDSRYTDLQYEWFKDGLSLGTASGPQLVIENAELNDSGEYFLEVKRCSKLSSRCLITSPFINITIIPDSKIPTPEPTPTPAPTPAPTPMPTPAPTPAICLSSSSTNWVSQSIPGQTQSFSLEFDSVPNMNLMNGVTGLSDSMASGYTSLGPIVRFNSLGNIDARNGGSYQATATVPYMAGVTYGFRLDIHVTTKTYDIYVTPQGSSTLIVGKGFAFRNEQSKHTECSSF
jgi:hypothetical protein